MELDFLIGGLPANPQALPAGVGITLTHVTGLLDAARAFAETAASKTATPFDDMALRLGGASLFSQAAAAVLHAKLVALGWGR